MVRAFLAIDLPSDLKKELFKLSKLTLPEGLKVKWVEEANFHLTLHFFGNLPETLIEKISKGGQRIFESISPFTLNIDEVGIFPVGGNPRVLWIGLKDQSNILKEIDKKLRELLKKLKLEKKEKFHPHITLFRIKELHDIRTFQDYFKRLQEETQKIKGFSFPVKEIVFFKSELKPQGPVYTPLKVFPLRGGAL